MDKELIFEVKKKREFSKLPDSIVRKALMASNNNVKEARAFLRKYFGVFMTNKVLKGKTEEVLDSHISSKLRDYKIFYKEIFKENKFESVIDLGCGANGFSYNFLEEELGDIEYIGIEASGQIVDNTNDYFKENKIKNAKVFCEDLFNTEGVISLIKKSEKPTAIFLLQVVDALEKLDRNYSKQLINSIFEVLDEKDLVVITMPLASISGKKKFEAKRTWLSDFLEEKFYLERDFELGNERVFLVRKK
jgi:SAM-dependent methyltransferase